MIHIVVIPPLDRVPRSRVVVAMRELVTRWSLAAVLMAAALVNAYLAASEGVLWPVALALVWVSLAASLLAVETPTPAEPTAPRRQPSRKPARV